MRKKELRGIEEVWLATIQAACPGGVVEMPIDHESTYFTKLYPRLHRALSRIKGAAILDERDWSGDRDEGQVPSGSFYFDAHDPEDWEADFACVDPGPSFSYHLFLSFVSLFVTIDSSESCSS